ncbi:glucose-6-phosphate dehydrogenase [Thalassolituus oleivorans]|jgi:glucose-6-phosphate 1-dehydrogenase|uniref:Glucose-6-phosphate 1-dehydrogenase n=1 Tax=hydrothermal vent metagenome TaxID=652676 RepID=A0A161KEA6_9ZZZZ|nr:glucose-6-phosphate dehydrogenase [Thalassolituus oleivorans]APR66818.1 glucose-6-phosphate dehydrogenase [Thalassolituus oleivorans]MBQ0728074.1 glucose-6-phosphate dehydrogenase [Thalassolituus oleivorans]MBQ0779297.1 glucose-6-phosphate dehydrogenase [Thalassolituus oleivorans]MCA6128947.1 glucose-6-phosphate dehydrogenase [Thalassolituus oleivorans 4BN06-13]MDF1640618.1 glucose-6-phosphate dehydrogenase [Thalassolituus oleivorans]
MHINAPYELVLFGGLGDLALRKLMPALYLLYRDGRLPSGRIFAATRQTLERGDFLGRIEKALKSHLPSEYLELATWEGFSQCLHCLTIDLNSAQGYLDLATTLGSDDPNRVYYLATGSDLYTPICQGLHDSGLIKSNSKIVLEKPIGHDYESASAINNIVSEYFDECQIYRIDHYLGKETVQNLMVLRFANSLFESQWNQHYIDHIQITISESIGVEKRAEFYEQVGAMRDMFQNHLLQLLCITAMEPPARLDPDSVRDEKVKVLRALKPIVGNHISDNVVRGQYDAGVAEGKPVPRYRDEPGVHPKSMTETFVAVKVEIDNWRWAGVPFYLRTGKRLAERACEIVVHFKEIPHSIFPLQHKSTMANKLVFRLQPDEGVRLMLCEKRVGPGMNVRPMNLSLNPANHKQTRVPEAYERLLFDVLSGNATLFLRDDELLEAWRWVDPILSYWEEIEQRPEPYTSGSWGPAAATLLLAKEGRLWDENS